MAVQKAYSSGGKSYEKEVRLDDPNKMIIAGVCSGMASYLDIDLSLFASFGS